MGVLQGLNIPHPNKDGYTSRVWVYDMRTNVSSFGKTRQLMVVDFAIVIADIDFLSAELEGKGLV